VFEAIAIANALRAESQSPKARVAATLSGELGL
jgi:hypothetical protein